MRGFQSHLRQRAAGVLAAAILVLGALAPAAAEPIRVVAFGDSLTAGYGLPESASFPARLEEALRARGHEVEIVNAGVSGETAPVALGRLDWSVPQGTDAAIVEIGANDMLRGHDPAATREAITAIVERLIARDVEVLLAGMYALRNLGADYVEAFEAIYSDLADEHDLVFYPFFLDGVAGDPSLNLDDGLHPNARGVDAIVEGILPHAERLLERVEAR